jgi:hypothetical protein
VLDPLDRRVLAALLLTACPPAGPPAPPGPSGPPPQLTPAGPEPVRPDVGAPGPGSSPGMTGPGSTPRAPPGPGPGPAPVVADPPGKATSVPARPDPALEAIAPRGRPASPGACEGGTRDRGETWKVDCNECSCGDDGQVTCTAMACRPRDALR